jgi:hypothetical protein
MRHMRRNLGRFFGAILIAGCCWIHAAAAKSPASLWFAPLDSLPRPWGTKGPEDYNELFKQKAAWQDTLRRVSVFKIYPQFSSMASADQLRQLIRFLKSRNIRLALEAGVLKAGPTCGQHVESYGGQYLEGAARRIKEAGGTLDYLAMDEPLWFGRHFNGLGACHSEIAELAADIARNLKPFRAVFPDVAVGDIEPAPASVEVPNWNLTEIVRWIEAFRAATGEDLAFFHVDMQWNRRWTQPMTQLEAQLRQFGIPLGVIYNGNPEDKSDQEFATHTSQHYSAMEEALGHAPDIVIFQSWHSVPSRALPDTDPLSMTGLVRRYLDSR